MSRIFKRKEGVIKYTPSTQQRLQLSRNYHVQNYLVKLTVTHTNSTAIFADDRLFSLINSIQLVGNGNENIKQIPGNKLYISNLVFTGQEALTDIKTADGTGLVSYVYGIINLSLPKTVRPQDTILNTGIFQSLDLNVEWGSSANLGTGITVTSADLTVYSNQLVNYKRNVGETIKYFEETSLVEEVTATTTQMTINLPVNKLYKSLNITSVLGNKRVNTIINSIKVKSGTTVIVEWDAQALQDYNIFNYNIHNSGDFTGIYVVDFTERGRLSDVLNTMQGSGFNTLELVLDVTKQTGGTNFVNVYPDTLKDTTITEQ